MRGSNPSNLLALLTLLVTACGDAGLEQSAGAGDAAVGACPGGATVMDRCVDSPGDDACAFLGQVADLCVDEDGDCFVADCDPAVPTDYVAAVADCDDRRPDVHGDAVESCNGRDDDCDGRTDEGFEIGSECEACGRTGKTECAVDDPTREACSVEAHQSAAAPADEVCDGLDDDCDGAIDEGCARPIDARAISQPAVCPDGVAYVADDVLYWQPDEGPAVMVDAERPAHPSCGAGYVAWLRLADEGCDAGAGPRQCRFASLLLSPVPAVDPRDLTGAAALGAPLIAGEAVYWHALVDESPSLRRAPLAGGSIESLGGRLPLSDPTPPIDGQIALRRWGDERPSVVLLDGEQTRAPAQPLAPAGPPTANEAWIVWAVGEASDALWVAPRAEGAAPFQLTTTPGPHQAPSLAGDRVVWLDGDTLTAFDLQTGEQSTLATGVAPGGFAADPARAVWVVERAGGPALVQWWWPR